MGKRNTADQQRVYVQVTRDRRKALGLKRVELWIHPDDAAEIKRQAAAMTALRIPVGCAGSFYG